MYKLEDIRNIHLELTSKCQARCPMCPRRIHGGILNPLIDLEEINLATFKEWFPVTFIKQLNSLFMCGNLGDPIIAQDCLEILEYLKQTNPQISLSMHTNGSARSTDWWKRIANTKTRVVFGIDGLVDTHQLYRIGTDWNKIIENSTAFISAGGIAEWHMLTFKHNEHQVDQCRALSKSLGFFNFSAKNTSRFIDNKFHVLDDAGKTVNILYPTQKSLNMIPMVQETKVNLTTITCKAKQSNNFYVAASGTISPCCWLDFSWILPRQDNRIDYMDTIGQFPNLHSTSLLDIFKSDYFNQIENTWNVKPLMECSKQCGSFDKLGAQFAA